MPRNIRVFRYDPTGGDDGHFDSFTLDIPNETATTILDVLLRLQQEQDPSLAFRFACRVNMCGSCGMVINGREALACKTSVSEIAPREEITIRPLNHFPVIKDLVVDMEPFFRKYEEVLPFFEPKHESAEPVQIRPDSQERTDIDGATECIACGCCVSSCTMAYHHEGYAGPAALNRAFTLLADSRDGLFAERLDRALASCYQCRTEFNCTEVCPKGISPTRAIKHIQRMALTNLRPNRPQPEGVSATTVHNRGEALNRRPWWKRLFSKDRQHPLAMATAVTCVIGIVYLSLMGFAAKRPYGQVVTVPDRPLTASETRGLYLYTTYACAYCHQIHGQGGYRTGPDLSNIVAKRRTRDYLVQYIRDPQQFSSVSVMPKFNLPESDLKALADFVLALDFSKYSARFVKREEVLKHE